MAFDLTRFVDTHEDALVGQLRRLPSVETLQTVPVEPEAETLEAGTSPSCLFRDSAGRRYVFKASSRAFIAAEQLAYEVRRMGRRPHVPLATRSLEIPECGVVEGMIQPIVEHGGSKLDLDPVLWTLLQREVLLREHPWEWLLANLDTHGDQYILIGPQRHPLNIDWDHSMFDLHVVELTRFTKRGVAIAPIRNLLYDAYANRTLRFDFFGLRREAARIAHLDDGALARAVDRYGRAIDVSEAARAILVDQFLDRKHTLRSSFERLIATMRLERAEGLYGPSNPLSAVRRTVTRAQDGWQRLLVTVLHDRYFRPFFKLYRTVRTKRTKSDH